MMRTLLLITVIPIFLLTPSILSAEIITLKSGKVIEGKIISHSDSSITIKTPQQQFAVKYRMISSIGSSSAPDLNSRNMKQILEKFEQLNQAIEQNRAKRKIAFMQDQIKRQNQSMKERLNKQQWDPAPEEDNEQTQSGPVQTRRKIRQKKDVELFVTAWCPYCRQMEDFFRENGIKYTKYDIEKDQRGKKKYQKLGVRGIPVTSVGGQVISGFNPNQVLNALR